MGGNVARGPDGDIYAGNTGGGAYRVSRGGRQRWAYQAGQSVWTTPAFGARGHELPGSLGPSVFALNRNGTREWAASTFGYVVSSPALARDGTLYVGSFDGRLHAYDSATGTERWTFQTARSHLQLACARRGREGAGALDRDRLTDGSVYGVAPNGKQRWRYDTGDVVRSSP